MVANSPSRIWRLRFWLPRSMTGLIATSCLAAAVPLLAAVVLAGLALDRLSSLGEALVNEGIVLERLVMELQNEIHSLDRNVRQYSIVNDEELFTLFATRTEKMTSILEHISQRRFQASLGEQITTTDSNVRAASAGVTEIQLMLADTQETGIPVQDIVMRLRELRTQAEAIAASVEEAINEKTEELWRAGRDAQNVMFLSAVAFAPLTALLALGLSIAVSRPLQLMARGASALGHGEYETPIVIEYPQEMQQLGKKLDWLRRRLAQLEAEKEQFLRHVSHELKNPLATIREGVDLMRQGTLGRLTAQQLEVAQILDESTTGLDMQIRRLLAFAKWREGKEAEAGWFETRTLVEEVLRAHKPSVIRRGLNAVVEIEGEQLFGVREQIRVAFENIFVNALRHAPEHSDVEIAATSREARFQLSVRDYGPGIPESSKRRIFEPYVRGDSGDTPSIRGSGLGLSIVEEIVLSHGGSVEVEDAIPGTRFTMAWPVPESDLVERSA